MYDQRDLDTYGPIAERDVDLVLVLAIRASALVRAHFSSAVGLRDHRLVHVRRSICTADGREADIELRLGDAKRPHVIQIENKLDAIFQPGQQSSYASRRSALAECPETGEARALLVCPRTYAATADHEAFDGFVTYEDLRDLLSREEVWGRELAIVLQHAIEKHRRGGTVSPDDPHVTEFFTAFCDLAASAGLPRVHPQPRKPNAGFLWWPRRGTLSQPRGWRGRAAKGARLVAKFIHGHADIELTRILELADAERLEERMRGQPVEVLLSGPSLRLRMEAPVLDMSRTVVEQAEDASAFVGTLVRLRDWWEGVGRELVEQELPTNTSGAS